MKNEIIKQIEDNRNWILSSEINELIENCKTPQKGILRYTEIVNEIEEFKDMLGEIEMDGLKRFPLQRLQTLNDILQGIFRQIKHIQETDKEPNKTDADQKRHAIRFFTGPKTDEAAFYSRHKDEIWSMILESITLKNKDVLSSSSGMGTLIADLLSTKNNADEIYGKIEGVLKTSKEDLAKGGIGKHAKLFHVQAEKHMRSAGNWRKNSIGMIIMNGATIIALYLIIVFGVTDPTKKLETGILSILFISFLSYLIVLCVRSYFAEKHNQQINQHKANCLETYNTFIDSAPADIKSTILLHATQTIFSHQSPGFLSKEGLSQSPSPIMEIIRNVTKGSEK